MSLVLVTGGTGYIGSHTAIELLENGHQVVLADSLINSKRSVIDRLEKITNQNIEFVEIDFCNKTEVEKLFNQYPFDYVIHFAGLKAVGESTKNPLSYYRNNIDSTLTLCEVMTSKNVKNLIFSSSATVYGNASLAPFKETSPVGVGITNPYGQTKYMLEQILSDLSKSDPEWNITILRYFNPIGAHPSGLIGEDPNGLPNNLFPFIQRVATGQLAELQVFGDDYKTPDGTAIRDYIDVVDLAQGHLAALKQMENNKSGLSVYNLGTGQGVSVLEAIKAFESASGRPIAYRFAGRRAGDLAEVYSDSEKAQAELDWRAKTSLEQSCENAWRWQQFADSKL